MTKTPRAALCFLALIANSYATQADGQTFDSLSGDSSSDKQVEVEDGWVRTRDDATQIWIRTKQLVVHPRAATQPALKIRLIPDQFDMVNGNAAVHYLKASGFLEQESARDRVNQFHKQATKDAQETGGDFQKVPPYSWLAMAPADIPLEQANEYLGWHSFQPQFLKEGALRANFQMDRNYRNVDDPIAYLLPEVQGLRQVARVQSLRCRVAIAEDRLEDAVEIIGQQFSMARHLGQDDFLVSNLVGIAIASIAWDDALYLVQHPKAPNLYWAVTSMPSPLVDMKHSMAMERQFLYQQVKPLREVDERLRPAGYWADFIDRVVDSLGMLADDFQLRSDDQETNRAALVGYVAAAYPGARDYLIEVQKMPRKQVEAYPTAQTVFLAMVKFYDHWRDEFFKWNYVPFHQARHAQQVGNELKQQAEKYGWLGMPTELLLPAVLAARSAEARCDQMMALLRSVEGLRMYAANHDGKLPESLDDLGVPVPIEPVNGKPIKYERVGDQGVLTVHVMRGIHYRLVVKVSN